MMDELSWREKVFDEHLLLKGVLGRRDRLAEELVGGYTIGAAASAELRFRFPAGMETSRAFDLLAYWPAWQITKFAALELGSGVFILGDSWLAQTVVALCTVRGCLWHKWVTTKVPDLQADDHVSPAPDTPEKLLRLMPVRPDAVIVLNSSEPMLSGALTICKDKGTIILADPAPTAVSLNLYPDAHRRGLTIQGVSWCTLTPESEWGKAMVLLNRLFDRGLLPLTNPVFATNA